MKKVLLVLMIVLLTLAAVGLTGAFLFRHFVTNQITDRGGMENPDAGTEEQLPEENEIHDADVFSGGRNSYETEHDQTCVPAACGGNGTEPCRLRRKGTFRLQSHRHRPA